MTAKKIETELVKVHCLVTNPLARRGQTLDIPASDKLAGHISKGHFEVVEPPLEETADEPRPSAPPQATVPTKDEEDATDSEN